MVPKYNEMALPILRFAASKDVFTRQDVFTFVVDYYKFDENDLKKL